MNHPSFVGAFFLVTAMSWFAVAQEAQTIRWQLEAGQAFDVELNQTTNITTSIAKRRKPIGNEMRLVMEWQVESVEGERITIGQSIKRIVLKINAPSKSDKATTEVDTNVESLGSELGADLLRQIKPLIGLRYSVEMNSRGEILNVTVPDESMEALRSAPASMRLREVLTGNGLKDLLGQSAIVFPEAAIAPDSSWTATAELTGSFGKINRTSTCTFRGMQELDGVDGLTFEVVTKITPIKSTGADSTEADSTEADSTEAGGVANPVNARIEDFSGSGTIRFAPDNTEVLTSVFSNKMRTHRFHRDQTIVTTATSDITMKVTKK